MKTRTCHTLGLLAGLFAGLVIAPSALAYTAYELEDRYYAIVCEDGQIFSYSGGEAGLDTVGPALCEKHGGIHGGGGGSGKVDIKEWPSALSRQAQNCSESVRVEGGQRAQRCGRISTRALDRQLATAARTRPAEEAPARAAVIGAYSWQHEHDLAFLVVCSDGTTFSTFGAPSTDYVCSLCQPHGGPAAGGAPCGSNPTGGGPGVVADPLPSSLMKFGRSCIEEGRPVVRAAGGEAQRCPDRLQRRAVERVRQMGAAKARAE